tara:strand:+ start:878 stop:1546 length:669 start_codon:yes stop_codon:yes gene_type:complete
VKEIVLDTETTGLSVKDGHRIVEIGCIELNNLIPTKNVFHCYLNPERKVSESALKVHGYTDEFLSDKKKFIDVVDDFLKFIDGKKIIIHNADFDISHLNNELSLINKKIISKENVIDTLEIARNKYPGSAISLDALCKRFRVDNTKRKTHTALLDCELLSKVYINLIDQKEPIFQFKKQNESRNVTLDNYKNKYSKKIIKISKEELEIHKKFLREQLKKNFY